MTPDEENAPGRVGDHERHHVEGNANHVVLEPRTVRQLDIGEREPNPFALMQGALTMDPIHRVIAAGYPESEVVMVGRWGRGD